MASTQRPGVGISPGDLTRDSLENPVDSWQSEPLMMTCRSDEHLVRKEAPFQAQLGASVSNQFIQLGTA